MPGQKRRDGSLIVMPTELYQAHLYQMLCSEWGYQGLNAAKRAPVEILRHLSVLSMASAEATPVVEQPNSTEMAWGTPEILSSEGLTPDEILAGGKPA